MVPVWIFPPPRDVATQHNNEPRPKYFNSGMELIFRKSWNFFASSFPMHEIGLDRHRRDDVSTQNGRKLDMVRPRSLSQKFFVRPGGTFASSRRCDPVRGFGGRQHSRAEF
jgi:hypothetical protein